MRNSRSAAAAATCRAVALTGRPAARASRRLEEVREREAQVPAEWRALEGWDAVRVEPGVEAVDVGAAAIDRAVTVETRRSRTDVTLFTVDASDSLPIPGKGVGVAAAAAHGRANHVDRAVGHSCDTEQASSPWQPQASEDERSGLVAVVGVELASRRPAPGWWVLGVPSPDGGPAKRDRGPDS